MKAFTESRRSSTDERSHRLTSLQPHLLEMRSTEYGLSALKGASDNRLGKQVSWQARRELDRLGEHAQFVVG